MGCSASKATNVVVSQPMLEKKDMNNNRKVPMESREPVQRQNSGCKIIKVKENEDSLQGSLSSLSSKSDTKSERESSAKSTRTTDSGLGDLDDHPDIVTEHTVDSEKLKGLTINERPTTPDLCIEGNKVPRRKTLKDKRVSFGDRQEFEEVKNRINSLSPLGGIAERPMSHGGISFDILCPETGNRKKQPKHLKKLEKRKKRSKKLTREQLEEKMKKVEEKRMEHNKQIIVKAQKMNSREKQVKMALDEFARRQMEKDSVAEAC